MRFRAAPADALLVRPLDDAFTAVFHRPSGQTHLLTAPAPEILAALAEPMTIEALRETLASRYELDGATALAERVEELVSAGLVGAA